ncbi:MAG: trypsin-like serine protease [Sandaracinaceae bacterium]|nr:trypsin-like serine protease [Sandaracinaceae bacterium]
MTSRARSLLALALAACAPPPSGAGVAAAPIVDGTRELGEPAVVTVEAFGALALCTGTLIAPNVVLTAKHCVQAPGATAPYPITSFTVGVGDRVGATRDYRVRYVETTPGAYESGSLGLRGAIFGIDVAVLILREPIADVTPIPIRRDRPDDRIGQPFTAIGFGRRPDGDSGLKYKTTGVLDSIASSILYTSEVICSGDSGGPMIQEEPERRVIGVASFGEAGACPSSRDGYNALYEHTDLIDRALVLAGHCLGPSDEVCNGLDDDCDGDIDEGCAALGEACEEDADCAFAQLPEFLPPLEDAVRCEDLGAGRVCTRPCDPLLPAAGCSEIAHFARETITETPGLYCARTSGCEGRCAVGAAGALPDGEGCGSDAECASLACVDPGDGSRRCLPSCRADAAHCPLGEACAAASGTCGACVDASVLRASRQIGEPCAGDGECESGACASDASGGYCTHACERGDDCPAGFRCAEDRCARGALAAAGEPCTADGECRPGHFCAAQAGRRFCTRACEATEDCAAGLECVSAGDARVCAPAGALLGEACVSNGDCAGGLCEGGACTRACGAAASCPIGFVCRRDGEARPRCLRPVGGGCSAGRGGGSSSLGAAALALLLVALRRRGGRSAATRR